MRFDVVVAGVGEVGSALLELARSSGLRACGVDVDESRWSCPSGVKAGVLHVAFPLGSGGREGFASSVEEWSRLLNPELIVVHSTVLPGTTRLVWERTGVPTAYSPVLGLHGCIVEHLRFWWKWVAGGDEESLAAAVEALRSLGLRVRAAGFGWRTVAGLELAKLWENVYRALMIAAWQELHRYASRSGADVALVLEFIGSIHEVLGDRPPLYPGVIGGKCLRPSLESMLSDYPSSLLEAALRSDELRRRELLDEGVKREVELLAELAARWWPRWYFECRSGGGSG